MMFSSTPLASGADPGSVIVGLLSGLAGIVFATLTLRHHRQVWAWTRRLRASDDVGKDLDDALTYLRELAEHLSERDNRYLWMSLKRIIGSHFANYREAWEANRLIA
ncbi:hypothetical protein ABTX35_38995, partial [Streptomyces sp. NPDC096080]